MYVCVCLSVCMSVCVCVCMCASVCVCVCLSVTFLPIIKVCVRNTFDYPLQCCANTSLIKVAKYKKLEIHPAFALNLVSVPEMIVGNIFIIIPVILWCKT